MASDNELLQRYADTRSEEAFAELVRRHLNLVYFAALRRTDGQRHLAEDVSQQVFVALAREASSLRSSVVLAGWLYVATRHAAAKAMRAEHRRKVREQEAYAMQEIMPIPAAEADWNRLRPELDAVMDGLNERDRDAVLLRYFENRPFAEIGAALRISEDAARMRVDRTLDKLRVSLARRGITSTTAALAIALEQQAGVAAPAALAVSISGAVAASITIGATGSAVGLSFITLMSSTKIISGVASAIAVIAIGSAFYEASAARESAADAVSLNNQVRTAEARSASLQRELEQLRNARAVTPAAPAGAAAAQKDPPANVPSPARADDPLTNPEARRLRRQKMETDMELNIRPLFAKLGFSDGQWSAIKTILLDESEKEKDVTVMGRAQGLSTQEQERLIASDAITAKANLLALIGDDAHTQLIQWNQELALRNSAGELAARLLYTDEPLTRQQAEQYVKIVTGVQGVLGRNADGVVFLGDAAMAQLQGLLSPAQFAILQQQQLAHRTDRQISALSKK